MITVRRPMSAEEIYDLVNVIRHCDRLDFWELSVHPEDYSDVYCTLEAMLPPTHEISQDEVTGVITVGKK